MPTPDRQPKITAPIPNSDRNIDPRLLRVYVSYRLILALLFLIIVQLQLAPNYLGSNNYQLFSFTTSIYCIINTGTVALFHLQRWTPSETSVFAMLFADIIALTIMMHASSGQDGSLGYLLMVTVAASGIFQRSMLALALAATASCILISIALTAYLTGDGDETAVIRSGIFGILLFTIAVIFTFLTKRLTTVQKLAISESRIALQLQRLNNLVINKMRTGILVFDDDYRIEQLNERASMLLGPLGGNRLLARDDQLTRLPELVAYHRDWRANPRRQLPTYHSPRSNIPLQISFSEIRGETHHDTIMFLEDARTLSQHAQQLKNNSLGRLTASIAHEIRNPLGAISHAAQLLDEAELTEQEKKLLQVVLRHSSRVDQLVDDIMQLSRQKTPNIRIVSIDDICQATKNQIEESDEFSAPCIELDTQGMALHAPFDASQLQQVMTNLLTNALRHSETETGTAWARIEFSIQQDINLAEVRVYDRGAGVSEENQEKIFEPFFTTEKTGTGLGLYIARGLCEINFATLSYIYKTQGYFQIVFSDPAKQLPGNTANE